MRILIVGFFFFFQAEDGIRDHCVTGVQTCALPISGGGTNYWARQIQGNGPIQDTYDNLSAHSAEKFMGMPLLCCSCHNGLGHLDAVNTYLKGKSRYDFWGNAAFFSRSRTAAGATAG